MQDVGKMSQADLRAELASTRAELKKRKESTLPAGTLRLDVDNAGKVVMELDSTGPSLGVSKNGNTHLVKAIGQPIGKRKPGSLFLTYTLGRFAS